VEDQLPAAHGPSPARSWPGSSETMPRAESWRESGRGAIRGLTIGPIENSRHPDRGYGTWASARAMDEARVWGASWVSLTPFGRVADLDPAGVDLTFEAPFEDNRAAVLAAIRQAHERGLHVMLVPHLWVESGEWRALIEPPTDAGWERWAEAYRGFVLAWAEVAREGDVELFSVGVELRSWVTTHRAPRFEAIVADVRKVYPGLLTYSANWDDAEDTRIWGSVDLLGINAFYPLAEREGADRAELLEGGRRVAAKVDALARQWSKPVLLTEMGYTTRADPALRPWEWPDGMSNVRVDEAAQADAYLGLLAPLSELPTVAGFFVWRVYADPDDVSQEAEWGFSPRGKRAEKTLRAAFAARWASDPD
jgi:hypothetical protein